MIRHRVELVDVLGVRPAVLLASSDVRQHSHVREREVNVDRLFPECRVRVRVGIKSLHVYDQHWWQLRNVELLDGVPRCLAGRAAPSADSLAVKIHVEAICDVTSVDVVRWQLEAQVAEGVIRCTLALAHSALDGAFDLPVKEPKDEAFTRLCVLEPCFFGRGKREWSGLQNNNTEI